MEDTRQQSPTMYRWVVYHDDSRMFIALYIGLAVVLSVCISLFWLVVVVGVHFAFEMVRQRHLLDDGRSAIAESLWELRLDLALIVFAMAVALYMDFVIGVAGLRLAPRLARAVSVGARGGTRLAAWSRVLRGVLLSLDDAAQFLRAALFYKRRNSQEEQQEDNTVAGEPPVKSVPYVAWGGSWVAPWRTGDYLIAGFFAVSILLVVFAPVFTDHTLADAIALVVSELHPFPARP